MKRTIHIGVNLMALFVWLLVLVGYVIDPAGVPYMALGGITVSVARLLWLAVRREDGE